MSGLQRKHPTILQCIMANCSYNLLRNKRIIYIFDGDVKYEDYTFDDNSSITQISMPYLRRSDICKIGEEFGLKTLQGSSRWECFDELLKHCIESNQISELLTLLFSKKQFSSLLGGHTPSVIEKAYNSFCNKVIDKINELLYFEGYMLKCIGSNYILESMNASIEIQSKKITNIDRAYIRDISNRALNDVDSKNYDSAITKSRTLVEETFCYVIEKKSESPPSSGNINDLYGRVKELYHMHSDKNTDKRINTLLSGLQKIISSISEMRNKDSDAHGVGAARIKLDEHHARLYVNSAIAIADFILSVEEKINASEEKRQPSP